MPKFPRTARISIVIPLQRDEALFEETLLSVLENQPDDCQVVGVHNGTYSDPFDLGDEVELVTARSSNLIDLVRDATDATIAPIVHVLGTGMKVNKDWMAKALEQFEELKVAAVTPALTGQGSGDLRTGWSDFGGRYCNPCAIAPGESKRRGNASGAIQGFFLNAFFVRRRLLVSLLDAVAPAMNDPVAVSYAFGCLLKRAGWNVLVEKECQIDSQNALGLDDDSDFARGQCLAAIRSRVLPTEPTEGFSSMIQSAVLGAGSLGEMIGMLRHRGNMAVMRRAIDLKSVSTVEQLACLIQAPAIEPSRRRAA